MSFLGIISIIEAYINISFNVDTSYYCVRYSINICKLTLMFCWEVESGTRILYKLLITNRSKVWWHKTI